jgi:hypothetical protein
MVRSPGRARGGGPQPGSLKDFVGRVLQVRGGPLSVKDVTAAILKAGYRTRSKTPSKKVQIALAHMPNVVRVARGQYRLRS